MFQNNDSMEDSMGLVDIPEKVVNLVRYLSRYRYSIISAPARFTTLKDARRAHYSEFLIDYLVNENKSYPLLRCAGQSFPVSVFEDSILPIHIDNIPSDFLDLDENWLPELVTRNRTFYYLMRADKVRENRDTFIMKSIQTHPKLTIFCGVSKYFTSLQTAYSLEWEILTAVSRIEKTGKPLSGKLSRLMPLRSALRNLVTDPVINGDGRANSLAISVLTAYETGNGIRLMLRRRGKRSIAVNRGQLHVLPAGMFQAPYRRYRVEFSIRHNMLWEYYEEFFNKDDPQKRDQEPTWFYGEPEVSELIQMMSEGIADVYLTGVAVDLLSLRTEILLLMIIKDKSWYNRHSTGCDGTPRFKFCDEFGSVSEFQLPVKPVINIEFDSDIEKAFTDHNIKLGDITPPGVASLYMGIKALNKILAG